MKPVVRLPVLAMAAEGGGVGAGGVGGGWWQWWALACGVGVGWGLPRGVRWMGAVACLFAALAAREGRPRVEPPAVVADDRGVEAIAGWVSGPLQAMPGAVGF